MSDKPLQASITLNSPPLLTIEEINAEGSFAHLSDQQKQQLILLVYEISIVIYHLHFGCHD